MLCAIQKDLHCETVVCDGARAPLEMSLQGWAGAGMSALGRRSQGMGTQGNTSNWSCIPTISHPDCISSVNSITAEEEILLTCTQGGNSFISLGPEYGHFDLLWQVYFFLKSQDWEAPHSIFTQSSTVCHSLIVFSSFSIPLKSIN